MAKVTLVSINEDTKTLQETAEENMQSIIGEPATEVIRDTIEHHKNKFLDELKWILGENVYENLMDVTVQKSPYIWAIHLKICEVLRMFDYYMYQIQQHDRQEKTVLDKLEKRMYDLTTAILKDFWTPDEFYAKMEHKIR